MSAKFHIFALLGNDAALVTHYRQPFAFILIGVLAADTAWAAVQISDSPQGSGRVYEDYAFTPDGQFVLYRADFNGDGVPGLYSAPSLAANSQIHLDSAGPQERWAGTFRFLPNQNRVVFDTGTSSNTRQLFSSSWDQTASQIQLSDAGGSTGGVRSWTVTPDGNRVVYRADFEAGHPSEYNVYTASTTAAGSQVPLTDLPPDGTGAAGFLLSNDATKILFIGQFNDRAVHSASAIAKTAPIKISSTPPSTGQSIFDWRLSPTGDRIIYESDMVVDNRVELFSAAIDASNTEIALVDHSLVPSGDVSSWFLTPNGQEVVYSGYLNQPGVYEIYKSSVHNAGTQVRLNVPPVSGGGLNPYYKDLQLTPDGVHAVYRGDFVIDGARELFSVAIASPGAQIKLSSSPGAGQEVGQDWQMTPDGGRVVYTGDMEVNSRVDLYSAAIGTASSQIRLSDSASPNGDVDRPVVIQQTSAYYVGDLTTDTAYDLYRTSLLTAGTQAQLTSLSPGDRVTGVQVTPDGEYAVFAVDYASHPGALYALPAAGGPLIPLGESLADVGTILDFQILPDSRTVVFRTHTSFDMVCGPLPNCLPGSTPVPVAARPALFAAHIPDLDSSGDFNGDGQIDAADYVVWRTSGAISGYYELWRSHFGQPAASGFSSTASVPEPSVFALLIAAASYISTTCFRRLSNG